MIVTIHGQNLEITKVIKNAVEKSLERLEKFKKFISFDTKAKVEIRGYTDKSYKITVSINLPYNKHLQCQMKEQDLYVAIKKMVKPLTNQLNYLKTQLESKDFVRTGKILLDNDKDINSDYIIEEFD